MLLGTYLDFSTNVLLSWQRFLNFFELADKPWMKKVVLCMYEYVSGIWNNAHPLE